VEREEGWVGDGAREPALELEGWEARDPALAQAESVSAPNAGQPLLTRPERPVFR
jgi:hypothetical protein